MSEEASMSGASGRLATMDHDMRRLRCFITIAELLHFRKAAAQLDMSPPSLTLQIHRLEEDLGCRVFDRTSRQVRLTEDGRALLPLACDVLAANDRLVTARRQGVRRGARMLRVGISPTAPGTLLRSIITELAATLGDHRRVVVHQFGEAEPCDALRRGEVDAAFMREPAAAEGVRATLLFREPRVVVMARDHLLADQPTVVPDDLAGEILIPMACGPPEWRDHWLAGLGGDDLGPTLGRPVTGFDEMRQVCALGGCVGIAPASIGRLYPHPQVAYVRVAKLEATRVLLCTRADSEDPALSLLERVCGQVVTAACRKRQRSVITVKDAVVPRA